MDRVIEFSINHWPMVTSFVILTILAISVEIRRSGKSITTHELTSKINNEDALVLDVREAKEFSAGHLVDSVNIPLMKLDSNIASLDKHKDKPVVVVCSLGQHSGQAVRKLQEAGFEQVFRLSGGVSSWRAENLPVVRS